MVETRGQLDQVAIDHGTLAIEGWAATVGAGSVDGFTVTCSGWDVTDVDLTAGLPGPDVEADYQWLDGSGRRPLRADLAEPGAKGSVPFIDHYMYTHCRSKGRSPPGRTHRTDHPRPQRRTRLPGGWWQFPRYVLRISVLLHPLSRPEA